MRNRSSLGLGAVLLVAIVALIFGAIGGAAAASRFSTTKVVTKTVPSSAAIPASSLGTPSGTPMSWAEVARRDGPAVVTIINQQKSQTDLFGNQVPGGTAEGSGFVISHSGDILTNFHVIDQEQSLKVVFSDGRRVPARLVRGDQLSDLAVIKVNASVPAVLRFGDSSKLQPGQPLLAIGSALGQFRNTVTAGVVSALGRSITEPDQVTIHDMVQTDAAINQGNSGGPLLDDRGEVVGINTAITRGTQQSDPFGASQSVVAEGLGFAISSSTAEKVALRLEQNKPPAQLGVIFGQVTQQYSTFFHMPLGAYVQSVKPGSPAQRAGIQPRDVITKIDGHAITDTYPLNQAIYQHAPGDVITLTLWRNGKTLTVKAKLAAQAK